MNINAQALQAKRDNLTDQVYGRLRTIDTPEDKTAAEMLLHAILATRKEIASAFDPIIEEAKGQKARYDGPLALAEKALRQALSVYLVLEKGRRDKEDAARRAAELEKKAQEARLRAAEAAEKAGDQKAADEILEEAARVEKAAPPPPPPPPPRPAPGQPRSHVRVEIKGRIRQPDLVPREFCSPDLTKVNAEIRRQRDGGLELSQIKIPGIDVVTEETTVLR